MGRVFWWLLDLYRRPVCAVTGHEWSYGLAASMGLMGPVCRRCGARA